MVERTRSIATHLKRSAFSIKQRHLYKQVTEKAISNLSGVLKINTKSANAYRHRGYSYLRKGSTRNLKCALITICLIVLVWRVAGATCPEVFSESQVISPAKSSAILSPNKQFLAWSVAILEKERELVRGQLFLRSERTGHREIIFETQIKEGKILSIHPDSGTDNYNKFCIIDWSPDSNYLLLHEMLGILYSDTWDDHYWIYDQRRRQRRLIDPEPLEQALKEYLQKKGLDLREVEYQAVAVGWAGKKSNRVLFEAFGVYRDDGLFLGVWSVAPTGRDPRLLTDKKKGFIVRGFGKVIDAP